MGFKKSIKTSVLSLALISSMAYADGLRGKKWWFCWFAGWDFAFATEK